MTRSTYEDLDRLASQHGLTVLRDSRSLVVRSGAEQIYKGTQGQKLVGAIEAVRQYAEQSNPSALGSEYPVTRRVSPYNQSSITAIDRNYDQERPSEYPVRDTERARRLQEMFCDGGLLDAAVNEIVDSTVASSDGDDRGWVVADTVAKTGRAIKPEVAFTLSQLYDRAIGGSALNPAIFDVLRWGDCFSSIALSPNQINGFWQISGVDFLPTFELFRKEQQIVTDKGYITETHFEQRRYLSDEDCIIIPSELMVHWRFRHKGGLYGTALFDGQASYRAWQSLRDAESDLKCATRNVGVKPLAHIFADDASDAKVEEYKRQIDLRRKQTGLITDYYMIGGEVKGVSNLDGDVKGLTDAIEYWRKVLAVQSRVPGYLLGLETQGAKDITQQPALAYSRLLNSLRQDLSKGIRQLCDTELMLHGFNPNDPMNAYDIVWPKIIVNAYEAPVDPDADESELIPDIEADRYLRSKDKLMMQLTTDQSEMQDLVYTHQKQYWSQV